MSVPTSGQDLTPVDRFARWVTNAPAPNVPEHGSFDDYLEDLEERW